MPLMFRNMKKALPCTPLLCLKRLSGAQNRGETKPPSTKERKRIILWTKVICNFHIIDLASVLVDLNIKDTKIKVEIDFVTA